MHGHVIPKWLLAPSIDTEISAARDLAARVSCFLFLLFVQIWGRLATSLRQADSQAGLTLATH